MGSLRRDYFNFLSDEKFLNNVDITISDAIHSKAHVALTPRKFNGPYYAA